jgi:hypothetical protein
MKFLPECPAVGFPQRLARLAQGHPPREVLIDRPFAPAALAGETGGFLRVADESVQLLRVLEAGTAAGIDPQHPELLFHLQDFHVIAEPGDGGIQLVKQRVPALADAGLPFAEHHKPLRHSGRCFPGNSA